MHGFVEPPLSRGVDAVNCIGFTLTHSTGPSEHPVWPKCCGHRGGEADNDEGPDCHGESAQLSTHSAGSVRAQRGSLDRDRLLRGVVLLWIPRVIVKL